MILVDLTRYYLKDIPFLAIPAIDIDSSDTRANGRLFCEEIAEEPLMMMKELTLSDAFPMIFVRTESAVLGNGKSAFLAAAYWDLYDKGKNVVWARATLNPRIRDLLSRILDSFVKEGKIKAIREKLYPVSPRSIRKALGATSLKVGSSTVYAVNQLIRAEDHELTYIYSNIRRRIPVLGHVDLFGSLLRLFYATGNPRLTIFIDQFEEYVRAHRSTSTRIKLSNELNDLLRAVGESTTLVVTTHPEAEGILSTSAPEFETFIRIEQSSVDLPSYDEEELVKMTKFYLREFRARGYRGDDLFPFEEDIVRYAAHRTDLNPRNLMIALRVGLVYLSLRKHPRIDEKFLNRYHKQMFGGLVNKWKDFKSGKFRYGET